MKNKTYIIEYGFIYPATTWETTVVAKTRQKAIDWFNNHYNAYPSFISLKTGNTPWGFINRKQVPLPSEKAKFTANW